MKRNEGIYFFVMKKFYILIHVNGLLNRILLEMKGRFAWKQGGE
ncbi:hypothetical protein BACERE00193_03521 [Bacillus paranthracis]|uniref:Uncharacterized protein n=1 Tax=Bacillus paranthracis TaxID=2026186 RepID=A0A9X8XAH9_9BACI|nr:hypothetical protein bcere0001_20560 [Bacillus cereus m1293]EJR49688.1 hypothetical protein IIK_02543 [Bacillus cereus VD102]SME17598.1 hypothetical protein BACERE00193_03521 [Bacillus paranthracis]SME47267.1 hypothetical protein BACERE00221_04874 [Bacillus paranthracis]